MSEASSGLALRSWARTGPGPKRTAEAKTAAATAPTYARKSFIFVLRSGPRDYYSRGLPPWQAPRPRGRGRLTVSAKRDIMERVVTPRVVVVKSPGVWTPSGALDPAVVGRMFVRGFLALTGESEEARAAAAVFRAEDRVGIKVNTIGGKAISTRPEVAQALAAFLVRGGVAARNIVIWDRTTRELRDAGFAINTGRSGVQVFGTDADGAGYGNELLSHLDVGSLF